MDTEFIVEEYVEPEEINDEIGFENNAPYKISAMETENVVTPRDNFYEDHSCIKAMATRITVLEDEIIKVRKENNLLNKKLMKVYRDQKKFGSGLSKYFGSDQIAVIKGKKSDLDI